MMAPKAGALKDDADRWNSIDWKEARRQVKRLQVRIAKAVKDNRWNKVKVLQYLLTHSFHAKLLAVKRVTSNKGKNTPGVDGVLWKGARAKWRAACSLRRRGYQPQPLRRIYIPKKNGKLRPLSIPVRCAVPRRSRINFIRYADDFIITGKSRTILEDAIKPVVEAFLRERGLSLSPEKTLITHITDGFTFLGQTFRKEGGVLHFRPSTQGILALEQKVGTLSANTSAHRCRP